LLQGIAKRLIDASAEFALSKGVTHLYTHVIADNAAAVGLYVQQCQFLVEQEESESFARALNRPRRLLLYQALSQGA
jgi:ribosomal protein S18 acetylase RimI-like enzyme